MLERMLYMKGSCSQSTYNRMLKSPRDDVTRLQVLSKVASLNLNLSSN